MAAEGSSYTIGGSSERFSAREGGMHIAHFVHRYPPAVGGCEAYVARLGQHLADLGDRVSVWTSTAIALNEMWELAVSHGPTPADNRKGSPAENGSDPLSIRRYPPLHFPARRYVLKAASLIPVPSWQVLSRPCNPVCPRMWRDARRYVGPLDAVHAFAFPYSFPAACGLRLARRRGVPFLLTPFLHLGNPTDPADRTRRQYTSRPLRWLLRQADVVFAQTPSEQAAVLEMGVPADRVVLQGLGVDPTECTGGDRDARRRTWGVDTGEVVVGHLANQSVEKGTVDLLRAAELLWARGQAFRVVLAGPQMPNFRKFWSTFADRGSVLQLGILSDMHKRDFFAGIDVFALPSRTDSFGLVLLEAWANGKPNVCYHAGGPADLIREGGDGFLTPCGDVAALAARLSQLVTSRPTRESLGEAGQMRIGVEFRWQDKLDLVRETVAELIAGRRVFAVA